MAERVAKVFVGSTSTDLQEHRAAVRDALLAVGFFPIMMEYFPAMDADAVAACMDKVAEADLYVGIYAHRYGYIPEGCDISITEMEFNKAGELKKKRFCFLVDPEYPWSPKFIETGTAQEKLQAFKNRINKNLVRKTFTTADSLKSAVLEALTEEKQLPSTPPEDRIDPPTTAVEDTSFQNCITYRSHDCDFNGCKLRLTYGNLADFAAEVLVSSDDNLLSMRAGVANTLARAAGWDWINKEKNKYLPLEIGKVAVTSGGELDACYIFHPVTIAYRGGEIVERPTELHVQEATIRCLRLAEALGVESIAFPALATGSAEFPPQIAASAMARSICDYMLMGGSLKRITIVIFPGTDDSVKAYFEAIIPVVSESRRLKWEVSRLKSSGSQTKQEAFELYKKRVADAVNILSETPTDFAHLERLKKDSDIEKLSAELANFQ